MTDEQQFIQQRLQAMGMQTILSQQIVGIDNNLLTTSCTYSGDQIDHVFSNLLLVTGREPVDSVFQALKVEATRIGDCLVPSSIADAVYAGHKFAREFEQPPEQLIPRRERALILPASAFVAPGAVS